MKPFKLITSLIKFKYSSYIFFILSFVFYFIVTYSEMQTMFSKIDQSLVLKDSKSILKIWGLIGIFQKQIAWFPILLFLVSLWKGSVFKRLLIIYPLGLIVGQYLTDIVSDLFIDHYQNKINSGTLIKTIVNSPQAMILVVIFILFIITLFMLFIKKKKIFWFSFLTMLAFFSMNVIYHFGLIQGTMIDVVADIHQKQEVASNIEDEKYLKSLCQFQNWKCIKIEINNNEQISLTNNTELNNYIGESNIIFLQNTIRSYRLETNDKTDKFFGRNFSVSKDNTAYLGYLNLKYDKINNKHEGTLIIDASYFKKYFLKADLYLSSMLLVGNLFWILMILFLVNFHERFLNKKTK